MTTNYEIEIASDTPDRREYRDWLAERGHTATIGRSTESYLDGQGFGWSDRNDVGSPAQILDELWTAFCNCREPRI